MNLFWRCWCLDVGSTVIVILLCLCRGFFDLNYKQQIKIRELRNGIAVLVLRFCNFFPFSDKWYSVTQSRQCKQLPKWIHFSIKFYTKKHFPILEIKKLITTILFISSLAFNVNNTFYSAFPPKVFGIFPSKDDSWKNSSWIW